MIRLCTFIFLSLCARLVIAQAFNAPLSKDEIKSRDQNNQVKFFGYKTSVPGWVLMEGDTLSLGKGSLPNKDFAFIYENPGAITATVDRSGNIVRDYLRSFYTNKRVVLKTLAVAGGKKIGFSVGGLVGVGNIVRYYVEIDNAIEAGEVLPPSRFRQNSTSTAASTGGGSVADELLKLKSLLDAGAITQQEYDNQKKKLLN